MQLSCPFCRRKPTIKTLARYNPRAAALGGLQAAIDDRHWFYAWCIDCGFAKQAQERACCDGDRVPPIHDFKCADCGLRELVAHNPGLAAEDMLGLTTNQVAGRVTSCPHCGVMVEKVFSCPCSFSHCCLPNTKIYGCNHIECQCGQHFCHVCGGGFDEDTIYQHMSEAHGGAYDDELYSDDDM